MLDLGRSLLLMSECGSRSQTRVCSGGCLFAHIKHENKKKTRGSTLNYDLLYVSFVLLVPHTTYDCHLSTRCTVTFGETP